jgi:hypothetical protein
MVIIFGIFRTGNPVSNWALSFVSNTIWSKGLVMTKHGYSKPTNCEAQKVLLSK